MDSIASRTLRVWRFFTIRRRRHKVAKVRKFSLYVWTDVFADWTGGIAFALAGSVTSARKLIVESYAGDRPSKTTPYWHEDHVKGWERRKEFARAELSGKPNVYASP